MSDKQKQSKATSQISNNNNIDKQKPKKKNLKNKVQKEKEDKNDEDLRKSARTPHKGTLEHYMKTRHVSLSQGRKTTSSSPAGERKRKTSNLLSRKK